MKKLYFLFICLFLNSILFNHVTAQQLNDTAFYKQSISNILALYKSEISENLHLYNGTEYAAEGHGAKGFPYFESDSLLTGNIYYDGQLYQNINMHYDLVTDEVIINDYTQNFPIMLVSEKINYFSVLNHLFINIITDNNEASFMKTGFYDEILSGKISLLAKREKQLQLSANAADNDAKYSQYNYYFIEINNTLKPIEGEHSILDLLIDKRDQLKKYIRSNKINFKKDLENSLIKTVKYYNQLIS